jgi:signal transduction histidine kinase
MTDKAHRVLVVDDEELNVRFLSTFLRRKGYAVESADRGLVALRMIESQMPDIILLDAMMPEMDGFEVCRRLRENPKTRLLPVIMVTALHSVEDEVKALDSGADDFLPKPINNLELIARLRSQLRIKSLHDELAEHKVQLEEKNKKLEELQGLRDSLTQMVVHDLKNPLTGIMGCTELLASSMDGMSDKHRAIVRKIEESSMTMLKMITDMLDISRMEENKVQLRKEHFYISELFDANMNELSPMMAKNNIRACVEIEERMPPMEADKDLIHRVVANLLHNAVKHSMKNGRVWLRASYDPSIPGAQISVKDEGEGVPAEYREKIFEKFAQADLKKLGLKTDRGLGLTFCKLAVEAHGGRIWVDSEVGKGSEFRFYVPLAAQGKNHMP